MDSESAPEVFMYAVGGEHTIFASLGGEPSEVTVRITPETAVRLNAAMARHISEGRKPYFDFNHEEREASFWPSSFEWRTSPVAGVYVSGKWSRKGAESVSGHEWRAFSPAFIVDKTQTRPGDPAQVVNAPVVMGGLVNDPAFRRNLPLWARNTPDAHPTHHNNTQPMPEQTPEAMKAQLAALEAENAALKAKASTAEQEAVVTARNKEIDDLKAKLQAAEAVVTARNKERAEAAITAAVARGVFPAQPAEGSDEAKLMARWRKLIEDDPAAAELLAKQAGPQTEGRVTAGAAPSVQTLSADVRSAVAAYGRIKASDAKAAMERGLIYARDIRRCFKDPEGAMHVLRADNTLGTSSGTLVVQRSLDLLKHELPMLDRISTNFSGEAAAYNQAIVTRLRSVPSADSYSTSTGYPTSAVTATDVPVTINAHKCVQVSFNANELSGTIRNLFGENEEGMHYALGQDMVDALTALITTSNFTGTPTTCALDQFARKHVIAMKTALNKRKVTGGVRTLLLNSDYHGALEEDTTVVSALINRGAGDAIGNSMLPPIAKFQPIEAPYLPTTGNLTGFGFRADALAIATRVPNDYTAAFPGANGGGIVSIVTNPDTGLSVMLVQFVNHTLGAAYQRVAIMYGVAKGNAEAGQILRSAAA